MLLGPRAAAAAPALPVSLAELKTYLRVGTSEEDALLVGLARSAAGLCESFTGRLLIARRIEEAVPASRQWRRLGAGPVRAIEAVAALDETGEAEPLAAEAYAIDIDAAGEGWLRLAAARSEKRLRVTYLAGLASDANGVPEAVRQGIVRLTAHFYAHRDRAEAAPPPAAVTALWRPWRRLTLGGGSHV
ncbi:MAG: head-tail connector protein [Sphingosinicella sp.]|uniref:head-tail connector protein n=1 Tax=Sphingosinicella sp. TaxID=1917971 RepID=UPI0040377B54